MGQGSPQPVPAAERTCVIETIEQNFKVKVEKFASADFYSL